MALILFGKAMGYMGKPAAAAMGGHQIRQHQKCKPDPVDKQSP
jgi:hypothetical protein